MGESLFIEPMKRLLQRRRAMRASQPESKSLFIEPMKRWWQRWRDARTRSAGETGGPVEKDLLAAYPDASTPSPAASGPANPDGARQPVVSAPDVRASQAAPELAREALVRESASQPEPRVNKSVTSEAEVGGTGRGAVAASTREPAAEGTATARQPESAASRQSGPERGARPGPSALADLLPGSLKEIFKRKVATNPQVKALLRQHGTVDIQELADDLRDLVKTVRDRESGE